MGVIKDRPRCAIDASSDEQQDNIFPVSDDDTVVGVGFLPQPTERHIQRRRQIRTRVPAIPTPSTVRGGRGGIRKCRRYENQLDLVKNSDLEEPREVTFEDLSPNSSNTFARLLEDEELLGLWNEFVGGGGGGEGPSNNGPTPLQSNSDEPLSKVCRKLRAMLRNRHLPLGLMDTLEENLLEHFSNKPLCTFESSPLDGFRRALLHALSQYNNLESFSMGKDKKSKVVRVRNKFNEFSPPPVRLVDYIENQRSRLEKF